MENPRHISINDYSYELPDHRIAYFPASERDNSRLLIYKDTDIREDKYRNIAAYLPEGSLLVFNNSKVINARIRFEKNTGGIIEVFCLEPIGRLTNYDEALKQAGRNTWKCFIGGVSKWKEGKLKKEISIKGAIVSLYAEMKTKLPDAYEIEFTWSPSAYSFAEIIEQSGDIPLPPYIKRETEINDENRYQTIYARHEGSVAAPTAGLHFTEHIFSSLKKKNIECEQVTLHVGAGTFKPVKSITMQEHEMHAEWIDVSVESIKKILEKKGETIAVGTTSLRTIESLYWLGVKAYLNPDTDKLDLSQWEVYDQPLANCKISTAESLQSLVSWLEKKGLEHFFTQTQILITPGYTFRVASALITNFHQPQSTLLLLVAAAVGNEWKKVYDYAMNHDFRFLSYGDGNLLFFPASQIDTEK